MAVEIKPSVLREQIEQGMKLDALAEHYGLPKTQMKKALQQLDLKIRRLHEPKFIIVEEDSHQNTPYLDSVSDEEEEESVSERVSKESESMGW